jgi:adenine-specific DNA-methyltransferase
VAELIWDGKYGSDGKRVSPIRINLPFQAIETVNESAQARQQAFDLSTVDRSRDWRNRLIWGDKKYVLPALLQEFAGSVDLIYIDPPFDTGADFSFRTNVDGDDFTRPPSIIEQKAYRDTWGRGRDSYLQWIYDTVSLLYELLSETGSLYVHLDWRMAHYVKVVLDEVFGEDNFLDNVVWSYQTRHSSDRFWNRKHDDILLYKKSDRWTFNWSDPEVIQQLSPVTIAKYKYRDEKGLYRLSGRFLKGSPIKGAKDVDPRWEQTNPELVVRDYLREGMPPNDSFFLPIENQSSLERTGYPTQKPTQLLRKLIKASSNEQDLILDAFVGSGTSVVAAEQLGRRWIGCDLSRFAIHTTRKRLLSTENLRPFVVQNLGKYERQLWQFAEFGKSAAERSRSYRTFILDLYHATPIDGYTYLHGLRQGRMVHVGTVDAPVTVGDIKQVVIEFRKTVGTGKQAPKVQAVDVLGWDFAFELNEIARQEALKAGIDLRLVRIPREVLDRRAVEQGDIHFYELAALSVKTNQSGRTLTLTLDDFMIPLDEVPSDVQKAVTHWAKWIDYWAVDWDNKDDTFHNEWQSYRTRKSNDLELTASHEYDAPGDYTVLVKVIDILGNDTTKAISLKVAGRGA